MQYFHRDRNNRICQQDLRKVVLSMIQKAGGTISRHELLDRFKIQYGSELNGCDWDLHISRNVPFWQTNIDWAYQCLKRDGFLKKGTPRGVWSLK